MPFYLVGWALPVLAMVPYVVVHSLPQHNSKCWTMSMGGLEWLHYPVPLFCLTVSVARRPVAASDSRSEA